MWDSIFSCSGKRLISKWENWLRVKWPSLRNTSNRGRSIIGYWKGLIRSTVDKRKTRRKIDVWPNPWSCFLSTRSLWTITLSLTIICHRRFLKSPIILSRDSSLENRTSLNRPKATCWKWFGTESFHGWNPDLNPNLNLNPRQKAKPAPRMESTSTDCRQAVNSCLNDPPYCFQPISLIQSSK